MTLRMDLYNHINIDQFPELVLDLLEYFRPQNQLHIACFIIEAVLQTICDLLRNSRTERIRLTNALIEERLSKNPMKDKISVEQFLNARKLVG